MPPKVRGKFLSAPSQSQSSNTSANDTPTSSQTRGKFLGKKPVSPGDGLITTTSSIGGSGDTVESTTQLKDHIHNSKIAAAARRKAIASQRQLVLDDLNEAENIVLSLLECASDVSSALSEMTTAKSKNGKRDESSSDAAEKTAGEKSFEDLTAEVRSNGVGYLAGVKKLHKLLAPHSSLVKSYKNHTDSGESSSTGESDKQQSLAVTSAAGGTNSTSSKIVEEATSNMYAVRVKKRLAMEKSEILQEMIRLEHLEEESETQQSGGVEEKDSTDTEKVRPKRKRK